MISGSGFSVDPDAVRSFGGRLADVGTQVSQAHSGFSGADPALGDGLGAIGAESGFAAAYAQRLAQHGSAMRALAHALGECGGSAASAVGSYEKHDADNQRGLNAAQTGL